MSCRSCIWWRYRGRSAISFRVVLELRSEGVRDVVVGVVGGVWL